MLSYFTQILDFVQANLYSMWNKRNPISPGQCLRIQVMVFKIMFPQSLLDGYDEFSSSLFKMKDNQGSYLATGYGGRMILSLSILAKGED